MNNASDNASFALGTWKRVASKQGANLVPRARDLQEKNRDEVNPGMKSIRDDLVSGIVLFIIDVYMRPG